MTTLILPAGWVLVALVVYLSRKAREKRLAADWPASARKWSPGA